MAARSRSTYPPLDTLKPVADGVWIVDSGPLQLIGMPIPVRMTVIRLSSGELVLHSPTQFTEGLRQELAVVGEVRHLVAPNSAHWSYVKEWQVRYPAAVTWAAPGLRERAQVKKSGTKLDHDLGGAAPASWAAEMEQIVVPGGGGFSELAFFHKASRTLLLTDLVVNIDAEKLPWALRPFARLAGVVAPNGKPPVYLRAIIKRRRAEAAAAARRMLDWRPERVIFSHGSWFDRDGTRHLRKSLRWLLD
jgi:hypothetical protein